MSKKRKKKTKKKKKVSSKPKSKIYNIKKWMGGFKL